MSSPAGYPSSADANSIFPCVGEYYRALSSLRVYPRYRQGVLHLEDVEAESVIARRAGPVMVYSIPQVMRNAQRMMGALGQSRADRQVYYAYKACPLSEVVSALHMAGFGAEVGSDHEYGIALRNGCAPDKIVWNSVCKSPSEMALVRARGLNVWHLDGLEEATALQQVLERGRHIQDVAVRVCPDVGSDYLRPGSKLGHSVTSGAALRACGQIASHSRLRLVGLHCHMMVNQPSSDAFAELARAMLDFAAEVKRELATEIRYLNLGGGFPPLSGGTPTDDVLERIGAAITHATRNFTGVVAFEPGRSLVDDAAVVVGRLLAKKEDGGRTWWITDINSSLLVPFGGRHFDVVPAKLNADAPMVEVGIADRASSYSAVLSPRIRIQDCSVGSALAAVDCGAYTYSARQAFIYPDHEVLVLHGGAA